MDIMSLRSGQQALQRDIRQQRAQASQQIIGGVGTMAGAAFDAYDSGMFSGGSGIGTTGIGSVDLNNDKLPDYLTQGTNRNFIGPRIQ